MLAVQHVSYTFPNTDLLFSNVSLTIHSHDKIALIGNNGVGKSMLLKIIAGELPHTTGEVKRTVIPYYVPQVYGQYDHLTVAQALKVDAKLQALHEIVNGQVSEENYAVLNDDWMIEERCREALHHWQLIDLDLSQKMETLSGGQKTKVFLAGISIHQPQLVLLDEPSNHLDVAGRQLLYDFIQHTKCTIVVVSHDRKLLNLLDTVCVLTQLGVTVYGGNYDFYLEQKQTESHALHQGIQHKEKELKKAREKERETMERQQKLDARGKRKQEKAGVARIMMNTLRNSAENSTSKIKNAHAEKIDDITQNLHSLRASLPEIDKIKFGFDHSTLHTGKILFTATNINFNYVGKESVWKKNMSLQLTSGERIALHGKNGSGKTTLIKLILGQFTPTVGTVWRAINNAVYIDQDYSSVNTDLNIYEQAQQFNTSALQEHDIKIRLNRFLFTKEDWGKPCSTLSGGERMRLLLCCLTIRHQAPDLIILDEPTNNLDIQNMEILTKAIHEYQGTLLVVSHDDYFLQQLRIERRIEL